MDKAHKDDYLKHLEALGMKDSPEYKRASKAKCSGTKVAN